ncbi:MAG: cysteine desulfurase [Candidatus Eremiobacteraeota bacterium]|nr:cysteine desulfurase [Candidatus Eremiobacteraeota bacterium]
MNARIYADHAATTPLRPEVLEAMLPYLSDGFNPSSVHQEGRRARRVLDDARAAIARLLGAQPREIIFTSGGSESDNLAIFGIAQTLRDRGRRIVTSPLEHHAVLHATDRLREEGWEIVTLPVDENGAIDRNDFARALTGETALVTLMLANNEIGAIAPIAELAAVAHERGVHFHTDAVQVPAYSRIDVGELGVDALSISAHKFYGPKGVGALYLRSGTPLRSQLVGGSQELAKRAGTENVAAIAGMAKALVLADQERVELGERLSRLRDRFEQSVTRHVPEVTVNGARATRLPHISNLSFANADADALVVRLDLDGIAVSSGSACAAGAAEPSHVISALYKDDRARRGGVRFSFGRSTNDADIERLTEIVTIAVRDLREASVDRPAGVI